MEVEDAQRTFCNKSPLWTKDLGVPLMMVVFNSCESVPMNREPQWERSKLMFIVSPNTWYGKVNLAKTSKWS